MRLLTLAHWIGALGDEFADRLGINPSPFSFYSAAVVGFRLRYSELLTSASRTVMSAFRNEAERNCVRYLFMFDYISRSIRLVSCIHARLFSRIRYTWKDYKSLYNYSV